MVIYDKSYIVYRIDNTYVLHYDQRYMIRTIWFALYDLHYDRTYDSQYMTINIWTIIYDFRCIVSYVNIYDHQYMIILTWAYIWSQYVSLKGGVVVWDIVSTHYEYWKET